jgi:para-aminobenzoate synthetase component 1
VSSSSGDPYAWFGGRLATGLVDVTADLTALDGSGWWAVVVDFEGAVRCARFDDVSEAALPAGPWPGVPVDAWTSSMTREQYVAAVGLVRDGIAVGDHYQVNLCRVLTSGLPAGTGPAAMSGLAALLAQGNPAPYAGAVHLPAHDLSLVSASPELFLRRAGEVVESGPIKGTAATRDGLTDKDRAENVMIVDLVRNDLGRVCVPGSVTVPALLAEEEHPGLTHLVSTIEGELRPEVGWAELLDATFPPGSVTGAPKLSAVEHIARLEPVPRGVYCGAVGWVDADRGRGELNVAIRTFWVEDGVLCLGTGGAVTWDSTPEGEWAETELKAARLLAVASPGPISPEPIP